MSAYAERLEALAAEAADRCTTCGKCFEVCPTAREAGLDANQAVQRVGELKALTLGGDEIQQRVLEEIGSGGEWSADDIKATFADGVLRISEPRTEEAKPRSISINSR